MKEQTVAYFHQMYEEAAKYEHELDERKKVKQELIAADDWDAVAAWNKREEQFKRPFTKGQYKAYWAFDRSEIEGGEFEFDDFLWDDEYKDFCDTLRAAGVTSFILTNESTALMANIHGLEAQGWRLVGTCKLRREGRPYGHREIIERPGLRFEIEEAN